MLSVRWPRSTAQACCVVLLLSGLSVAGGQGRSRESSPGQGVVEGLFGPLPATIAAEPSPRAFFLESATLRPEAAGSAPLLAEMPVGSSLEYVGETTDDFGREWSVVAYPWKMELHQQDFLAPFNEWEYSQVLGTTAVLVSPSSPASILAQGQALGASSSPVGGTSDPWWTSSVAIGSEYDLEFSELVGVDARTVPAAAAQEAIEILGGLQELGDWPIEPIPGQLHVPDVLPLFFRWNGTIWRLLEPVQVLGTSFGLLGNPALVLDTAGPEGPGGFEVPCWRLVGAMDLRGAVTGSVAAAGAIAAPTSEESAWQPDLRTGLRDLSSVAWPTVTTETATPPRVFRSSARTGLLLGDDARRHAVYLQQDLGPEITGRLRGRELSLDVWARTPPNASASAAIGIDVEVGGERFSAGGTVSESSTLVTMTFIVPEGAEWLSVRLLPLDTSLAVEQAGSAIFERAVLRLSTWPRTLDPSVIPLHRVAVPSYRPVQAYTRAPLAVTSRPVGEIDRIWERVVSSDWSTEDKQLVIAGRIRVGMTTEQVGLAWGEPTASALAGEIPGLDLRWDYEDRSAAFSGGELVSWTIRMPPPEVRTAMHCPCTEIAPQQELSTRAPGGGADTRR